MSASSSSVTRLLSAVEAAIAAADAAGPDAGGIRRTLDDALRAARALDGNAGRADEGIRPEALTTDNDK